MKYILFLASICMSTHALGQTISFYYPDGKKYTGKAKNIAALNKELEQNSRVYRYTPFADEGDAITSVGYLLFTDKPLWIMTDDTNKVKTSLGKFDLQSFLSSWEFEFQLKNYIEKGVLTDIYILKTLGTPTKTKKYVDAAITIEDWTYESLGDIVITFNNGVVTSYIK